MYSKKYSKPVKKAVKGLKGYEDMYEGAHKIKGNKVCSDCGDIMGTNMLCASCVNFKF
jgi:hypothetical protein